ncbi:MAG TPA: hypothetical protein VFN00_11185 [Arthrobacter sp.]|nr:hypothetical protein [Arthrobacter sp.]
MTEKDAADAAAPDPSSPRQGAAGPERSGKPHGRPAPGQGSRASTGAVSTGAISTRELQELARRRREAEEKLQQHLQEAKHKPADGEG